MVHLGVRNRQVDVPERDARGVVGSQLRVCRVRNEQRESNQ